MATKTKKKSPTKRKAVRKPKAATPEPAKKALILRTCNPDFTSHAGFKWPASGPVECPDWKPTKDCGNGLHGLKDGIGNWGLMNLSEPAAKWLLWEADEKDWVDIDHQKGKAPRGNVIRSGSMAEILPSIIEHMIAVLQKDVTTVGGDGKAAYSSLAASGNASIVMSAGVRSIAKAGENGCISLAWHDGQRLRVVTGYVGEDGIKAHTWYRAENGKLMEVAGQ